MRAKNEFRNIAANYDTKLILERVVDGKLMCPEACCGAPVVECTCGPDCPHCNCFMIHKAMKEKGFTNKLLKENKELVSEGIGGKILGAGLKGLKKLIKPTPKPVPKPGATVRLGQVREPVTVQLGRVAPDTGKLKDLGRHVNRAAKTGLGIRVADALTPDVMGDATIPDGKWSIPTHSATGRPAPTKSITSEIADLIPTIKPEDEEKQKGVDGKACWKGYRREGTKKKGGKTVDNCVKVEAVGHYDTHVRLSRGGKWNTHTVNVRKTDKELIQKFLDQGFKIEKPPEDEEWDGPGMQWDNIDDPYDILDATVRDFEQELDIQGDGIDTNVNELKDYVDIIKGLDIVEKQRESALNYLKNLRGPGGRAGLEDVDFEFVFGEEDNEEPRRGITGLNPRRSPELHSMKSHAIDKIDLNKWREYPAEDVMKTVYRRYGKELPSVDSYDWAITWDKKVRPWLKEHEGTF